MKPIEERKAEFKKLVWEAAGKNFDTYSKEQLSDCFEYWTEISPNGKKMRFEKEKTFDPKRRLATWKKNDETHFGRFKNKQMEKKFPNYLSVAYIKRLDSGKFKDYAAHLQNLGYIFQKSINGQPGYFIHPETKKRTWI